MNYQETDAIAKKQVTGLIISKVQTGGYIISEPYSEGRYPMLPLFACTKISEALAYVEDALETKPEPIDPAVELGKKVAAMVTATVSADGKGPTKRR